MYYSYYVTTKGILHGVGILFSPLFFGSFFGDTIYQPFLWVYLHPTAMPSILPTAFPTAKPNTPIFSVSPTSSFITRKAFVHIVCSAGYTVRTLGDYRLTPLVCYQHQDQPISMPVLVSCAGSRQQVFLDSTFAPPP